MDRFYLINLNSNSIVLITKFLGANRIEDYRRIVLANFQFKIKTLADRLSLSLLKLIMSEQKRG